MKRIYSLLYVFLLLLIVGCSDKDSAKTEDDSSATETAASTEAQPKKELLTFEDSLEVLLSDPWLRAKYNDNSGFYDQEFSYLTDDVPLDKYITYGQITFDYGMTVDSLKVTDVQRFPENDSALVEVEVTLTDKKTGQVQMLPQVLTVYYSNGRWIKPTVGVIRMQKEYEDKIREAIEAAEAEG